MEGQKKCKLLKWARYPEAKPPVPGQYLVTCKRPASGRWVDIRSWDGQHWEQGREISAWMELPRAYGGVDCVPGK